LRPLACIAASKTKTTGKPGSGFAGDVTDAIVLFRQEKGTWKPWSDGRRPPALGWAAAHAAH